MGETGVFRLTENGSGRIVTGETGLAHTRTVNCQFRLILSRVPRPLLQRCLLSLALRAAAGTADYPTAAGMAAVSKLEAPSLPIVDDEGCDFLCDGNRC